MTSIARDMLDEIQKKVATPSILAEKDQFIMKLAETEEEIEAALRLRYKIFNIEQGKGLEQANQNGMDRDEFDDYCLHLIVMDKETDCPVGTYRIHIGAVANSALGFYSSREYAISGLDEIADKSIEVGRSCVAPEYRNGTVVALLWRGISELLYRANLTYLIGCVSLETTDPAMGWALFRHFENTGKVCNSLTATPVDKFALPIPAEDEIMKELNDTRKLLKSIPPLLKGYLRLGTKICGPPALDHEFGTIDYLIFLNADKLPQRYHKHFRE